MPRSERDRTKPPAPISFTSTWTAVTVNPAIGNGTITATYLKTGRKVEVWIKVVAGSTTTFGTGNYSMSLPFPVDTTIHVAPAVLGTWMGTISGVNQGGGTSRASSSTTLSMNAQPTGSVNPSTPGVFANGDNFSIYAAYLTTS